MKTRVRVAADGGGVRFDPDPASFSVVGHLLRAQGHRPRREGSGWRLPWDQAGEALDHLPGTSLDMDAEVERAVENRRSVAQRYEDVTTRARQLLDGGEAEAVQELRDVIARTEVLDGHQLVAAAVMTLPGSWGACVFDEQGTGKTVTTMAAYDILQERGEADLMLVVSPKSMLHEWKAEFERFYGGLYKVEVLEGSRAQRAAVMRGGADVIVVNYEGVVSHEVDLRTLAARRRAILTVDESFFAKNPDALRTQALRRVREHCARAFVLCGTPAPNHPRDLVAQFDLVDFGHTFHGLAIDDDREVAAHQVGERLATSAWVRNRKDDVLELPTRTFEDVEVPMETGQQRAYDAAEEALLLDLRATSDAGFARRLTHFLARRAVLLQIASNPAAVVPGYEGTPGKWGALDSILEQLSASGEKVILWSFYRANLEALEQRYKNLGLVRIDGSTPGPQRRIAVDRFQKDPDVSIFLGNPAAAGAGLTLHAASVAVYESLSNQAAHYLQSLDRIHRRGQEREVRYLTLLSSGTIEVTEYERLVSKARRQGALLGDADSRPPTRFRMIEDILGRREA